MTYLFGKKSRLHSLFTQVTYAFFFPLVRHTVLHHDTTKVHKFKMGARRSNSVTELKPPHNLIVFFSNKKYKSLTMIHSSSYGFSSKFKSAKKIKVQIDRKSIAKFKSETQNGRHSKIYQKGLGIDLRAFFTSKFSRRIFQNCLQFYM